MVEIIRERNPVFEEDLKRDFRPLEVREGNFTYRVVGPDMRVRIVHRRQRKVLFVALDQNSTCETVQDLGPATQADPWCMPCDEGVERAQALELFDWALRKRAELAERRALVKPLRDKAFLQGIAEVNEEIAMAMNGTSSFGPYARVQREKASANR